MPFLSDIVLQSPDSRRLGRFLAELFELPLDEVNSRIHLKGPDFSLAIGTSKDPFVSGQGQVELEFSVENEEELHLLWQRYVFLMYRLLGERLAVQTPLVREKKASEETLTLLLKDPDQRLWSFKAQKKLQ